MVEVIEEDGQVQVTVRDDGSGFDPGAPSGGFGLVGMHERVALAGGRLDISSSGRGTTIVVALPAVHVPLAPRARRLSCL
jgi:signal transduction histidine kinase